MKRHGIAAIILLATAVTAPAIDQHQMDEGYLLEKDQQALEGFTDRIGSLHFENTPLQEVVKTLQQRSGVQIQVAWTELARAGIQPETTVTLSADDIAPRAVLDLLGRTLTAHEPLAWWIDDGTVQWSSPGRAMRFGRARGYDDVPKEIETLLPAMIEPSTWKANGGQSSFTYDDERLEVYAPQILQDDIQKLVYILRHGERSGHWEELLKPTEKLRRKKVSFNLNGAPVGEAMVRLGKTAGVPIVLDLHSATARGLDLGKAVTIRGTEMSAWLVLQRLMDAAGGTDRLTVDPVEHSDILLITPRENAHLRMLAIEPAEQAMRKLGADSLGALRAAVRKATGTKHWLEEGGEGYLGIDDDRFICRQTSDKLLQVAELVQARHYLQAVEDMELERMALRELSLTASQPAEPPEREPAPEREQPEPEREQARGETEKPEPEPAAAQPTRREEQMAQRELQIGNTQLKAGLPNRAMQSYRNVVEKYPRTAAAKVARKRIKELEPRRR